MHKGYNTQTFKLLRQISEERENMKNYWNAKKDSDEICRYFLKEGGHLEVVQMGQLTKLFYFSGY